MRISDWSSDGCSSDLSPFQGDQDPRGDKMPSDKDIERDMQLLAGQVRQIRTYSTLDGQGKIAEIADRYGLEVVQGSWLDTRLERNEQEIANLVRIAKTQDNVHRVLVGNETLLRGDMPIQDLIQYIRRVRTELSGRHVEVSTPETWDIWQIGRAHV